MKAAYTVRWTTVAELDLKNIIAYIAADHPQNALQIFQKIRLKASHLCSAPEKGRIVPELQGQGISQYRELVIPPWRLIYQISEQKIFMLSVLDSRQNIEDILLKRFIR
ncbi:type II toxin-antitoxin system RelE/ParE family toxin [Desulfoluna sp.]|uniref:type II toxin-antitoxin system RelE/ParE family toxin n=1 Tax=Desulfoluna sp. TaxID=2045199 RepID=UPI0026341159|nr:type II toxin-antitoxin system RelE/ParE family toxin [Desulfoluna sp.]